MDDKKPRWRPGTWDGIYGGYAQLRGSVIVLDELSTYQLYMYLLVDQMTKWTSTFNTRR